MTPDSEVPPEGDTSVVDCYRVWAERYDLIDNPLVAMAGIALASSAPELRGRRLLELGCGTGRNLAAAIAAGARKVAGIDASEAMLARARAATAAELAHADVRDEVPAALGRFDVILVSLVLEHLEDVSAVLRAAASAASPGAQLMVLELHPSLRALGSRAHVDVGGDRLHPPSFPHDEIELAAAGRDAGWAPRWCRSWYASREHAAVSAKLASRSGQPVLLELRFTLGE